MQKNAIITNQVNFPPCLFSMAAEFDPKELLLERFARLSTGDYEGIGSLLAPHVTYSILGNPDLSPVSGTIVGREAVLSAFAQISSQVLIEEFAVLEVVAELPRVAVLWRARLRNLTTGFHAGFEGVTWVTMTEAGEIGDLTNALDTAAFAGLMHSGDQSS
jgi:ketosteroid isomerase-like protein